MPGKRLTEKERAIIIALWEQNFSARMIASKLNRTHGSVSRLIRQYVNTGSTDCVKATGRPRKTSRREDSFLIRTSLKDRHLSSIQLKTQWGLEGISVSRMTIIRRLEEKGLKARRPRKKPMLTLKMMCIIYSTIP